MKNVFGYIRVSTKKQGDGVSLTVQKDVITIFAKQNSLHIVGWFEEKKSASKGPRPQFTRMMADLYEGKADGFVFHKIDRISRNPRDWAAINDLIDDGYEVHSATENIDLKKAAGRMVADFHAIIANNYSRNLAEEAKKGLYGRLKQGYLPFKAPLGYLNQGAGKTKTLDPERAPLIKKMFALYTQDGLSIRELVEKMYELGLRQSNGRKVVKNSIIKLLKNPYFMGIMEIKGQHFKGNHEPLISSYIYKKTQFIMASKANTRLRKHKFTYRKLITCKHCGRKIVGEKQRGHVYYRCHTKTCETKSMRETTIDVYVQNVLKAVTLGDAELKKLEALMTKNGKDEARQQQGLIQSLNLRRGQLEVKLNKLTDLLVRGIVEEDQYQIQQSEIITEQQALIEQQQVISSKKSPYGQKTEKFLELAQSLTWLYDIATSEEKRELLEIITSNLQVAGKKLCISMREPFASLVNRDILLLGGATQPTTRTKASTEITYASTMSSPIIPDAMDDEQVHAIYHHILEGVAQLPEIKLLLNHELPTNHAGTQCGI